MKNYINVFIVGLLILTANTSVFAQPGPTIPHIKAVQIQFVTDESVTPETVPSSSIPDIVRQLIGHAIGSGEVNSVVELEKGLCIESPLNPPAATPPPDDPSIPVGPTPAPVSSPSSPRTIGSLDSPNPLDTTPDPDSPAAPIAGFDFLVANLRIIQKPRVSLIVEYVEDCGIFN